jgi:hypothetical protein
MATPAAPLRRRRHVLSGTAGDPHRVERSGCQRPRRQCATLRPAPNGTSCSARQGHTRTHAHNTNSRRRTAAAALCQPATQRISGCFCHWESKRMRSTFPHSGAHQAADARSPTCTQHPHLRRRLPLIPSSNLAPKRATDVAPISCVDGASSMFNPR